MRTLAITIVAAAMLAGAAEAGYKGPHPVLHYNGNEYAVVVNADNGSKTLVIYRAVGSLWQRIGGTSISHGQNASNGSLAQDVWFNGQKIRTVKGDLRRPFYRLYRNQIDY